MYTPPFHNTPPSHNTPLSPNTLPSPNTPLPHNTPPSPYSISWRIMDCLQKANKTYNMYLHHVVTRDVVKIEALLNTTRAKRKKIDHEDVYKKLTNLTSTIDASGSPTSKDFIRPVIVCVGDSLTEGMGSSDDYLLSYPAILQRHPGFHHFQVSYTHMPNTQHTPIIYIRPYQHYTLTHTTYTLTHLNKHMSQHLHLHPGIEFGCSQYTYHQGQTRRPSHLLVTQAIRASNDIPPSHRGIAIRFQRCYRRDLG